MHSIWNEGMGHSDEYMSFRSDDREFHSLIPMYAQGNLYLTLLGLRPQLHALGCVRYSRNMGTLGCAPSCRHEFCVLT